MNYHFSQFNGMVKSLAGKFGRDSLHDTEDVEQELYCKLIKELPKLQKIPKNEIAAVVKTILKNEIRSIQRKSVTRSHLNCKLEYHTNFIENDNWTWEDAASKAFMALERYVPEHFIPAMNICAYADLASHILEWAQAHGGKIEELVTEFLDPSQNTMKQWYEMTKKFPSYKKYDHIPPQSVGKILGIHKLKVVKIMKELKTYLEAVGYTDDYLSDFLTLSYNQEQ